MTGASVRYAAALAIGMAVVGRTIAACSSDDSIATTGGDASVATTTNDANAGVTDAVARDAGPAAVDADCTAGISTVLTILVDGGYGDCITCLEGACKPELAACFSDCACTEGAISFFQCLYTGAEKNSCFAALANSGKDPQILGLYSSCGLGCTVCNRSDDDDDSGSNVDGGGLDGSTDGGGDSAADADAGFDAPG